MNPEEKEVHGIEEAKGTGEDTQDRALTLMLPETRASGAVHSMTYTPPSESFKCIKEKALQ
jgi:hypothetical protein